MKVREIYEYLQTLSPEYMAMEWDHVGLLCGRMDREVTKILVALDPFYHVCEEAKALGCELLVTHHPAIWKLETVNDQTIAGKTLLYLIESGISALNAHTNLDCAPDGVNDQLARILGLREIEVIDPKGNDAQGRAYGLLRGGGVDPTSPEAFVCRVKEMLHCEGVRYVAGGQISRVAVGGGSCSDALYRVKALGYDCLVTADCKYNAFADAKAMGITLIDAGHFQTENPVCASVAEQLRAQFPEIQVFESKNHTDCIKFA